jgi:hypothetical protein
MHQFSFHIHNFLELVLHEVRDIVGLLVAECVVADFCYDPHNQQTFDAVQEDRSLVHHQVDLLQLIVHWCLFIFLDEGRKNH